MNSRNEKYWDGERPEEAEVRRMMNRDAAIDAAYLVLFAAMVAAAVWMWYATGGSL